MKNFKGQLKGREKLYEKRLQNVAPSVVSLSYMQTVAPVGFIGGVSWPAQPVLTAGCFIVTPFSKPRYSLVRLFLEFTLESRSSEQHVGGP